MVKVECAQFWFEATEGFGRPMKLPVFVSLLSALPFPKSVSAVAPSGGVTV